ncbi:MAG: hypothetical protein R3C59_05440 [Planctomycetaceae bacterium]
MALRISVKERMVTARLTEIRHSAILQTNLGSSMTAATANGLAEDQIRQFAGRVRDIRTQLHETVVGQDETIDLLLTCALTGSHALLVGVPGLAKTCSPAEIRDEYERAFADHLAKVRTFALATGCDYRRVSLSQPWVEVLSSFLVERSG